MVIRQFGQPRVKNLEIFVFSLTDELDVCGGGIHILFGERPQCNFSTKFRKYMYGLYKKCLVPLER